MRPLLRLSLLAAATLLIAPWPALVALLGLGARGLTARAGAAALHLWARLACRALGVRVRSEGALPLGPCLIASNHLGYLDILVLGACYPGVFLSMAEVRGWPLVGALASLVGTLFIDRGRGGEVARARAAMALRLASGLKVTFFPEGRASRGREVGRFHSSLLEAASDARVPCVPAAVRYDAPPPIEPSLSICWWGDMTFAPHFRRLLALESVEACATFGAPVATPCDRKELARKLEDRVRLAFVPVRQPGDEPACDSAPFSSVAEHDKTA